MSSYHCHSCAKSTVVSFNLGVPTCQRCGSDFVEESAQTQVRGARPPDPSPVTSSPQGRVPQYLFPAQPNTSSPAVSGVPQTGYPGLSNSVILVGPPDHRPDYLKSQNQSIPISPQNNPFVYPGQQPLQQQSVNNPFLPAPWDAVPPQAVSPGTTSPVLSNLPSTVSYHPGSRVPHHHTPYDPQQPYVAPIYPKVGTPSSLAPNSPVPQHVIPIISPHMSPAPSNIFPTPSSQLGLGASLPPPPTREIPSVPSARSIYPVPPRGTDGDDLYGDETLPDISFLDLSQTRFKSDRDEGSLAASYISTQPPIQTIQNTQPPPQQPPPQETQIQIAPVQPQQPATDAAQNPAEQPAAAASGGWNIFTGIVDALRDGMDRLDEFTYMIAPDARTAAHYQLLRLRGGAPPASISEVQGLKTITITGEEMVNQKDCPICCLDWELGESAREMPCKHCFHEDCLMPWLKERNSCPICRYELPTEDRKYERYKEHRNQHT